MEKDHIKRLISVLNRLRIGYAFTGAFALSYYGYPRISSDIDILVEDDRGKLLRLLKNLQALDYDVTETDVQKAVKECSHFPVFHRERTFPYFDFKVACEREDKSAIENGGVINYHGVRCRIVSVEDLIVKKLEWNDLEDVKMILTRHRHIDAKKLEKMAKEKSVFGRLQGLLRAKTKEN